MAPPCTGDGRRPRSELRRARATADPARRPPRASLRTRRLATVALASGGALTLEVLECAGRAVVDGGPGLPAELHLSPARIERAALQFTGARRVVASGLLEAGHLRHDVEQALHGRLDARADVARQPAALVGRTNERVDDVV